MSVETIALITFYAGLIGGLGIGCCFMRALQLLGAVGRPEDTISKTTESGSKH